jgi:hypothetical protein
MLNTVIVECTEVLITSTTVVFWDRTPYWTGTQRHIPEEWNL